MKRLVFSVALPVIVLCRAPAADSVVVFNEIHYHPATNESASEWIELHNQMAVDIDLSAWHLEDGVNFTFPEGTIIPGGGYRVIASDPGALQAATGLTNVLGPFTGRLDNSGERLELRDRNERLMDRLVYADGGKWPLAADGSGATLAKGDPNAISDSPENWTSSIVTGGTPGLRNFPDAAAQARSLVALNALWRYEASGTDLGTSWREPGFNDDLWGGQNNATLLSYWPFNGNATAARGTNGTFVGAVSATSDRTGAAGQALAFSGLTQYVSVAGGGGLNGATAGTISLWARWNGTQDADCCGGFGAVLARQSNGVFSDNVLSLNTNNPATGRVMWRQAAAGLPALITGTTVVGTAWHHVAVTFSNAGTTLYIDGASQGTAVGPPLHESAAIPLTIGGWAGDGGGFMNGNLDDVAVWDQPLTAAQVAQLFASTKAPLDFSNSENAIYFSGDGQMTSNDELRRTALPVEPTTHYFRKLFSFADDPTRTELKLDLAVDDGTVVHLNGQEVYRHNMAPGPVSHSTLAAAEVGDTPLLTGITIPATQLVTGNNVLAVEVHQAAANDPGMVFGAGLNAVITPAGAQALTPDDIVFNEVSAAGTAPFQIELFNRGAAALDIANYVIRRTGASPDAAFQFSEAAMIIAPGGFLVLNQTTLGFSAVAGDKLFLIRPGQTAVADALEVHARSRARSPDGTGPFLTPNAATFGAANSFSFHSAIVFNEIMFHAPPTLEVPAGGGNPAVPFSESPEQWVELFNRSNQPVNLTGWRLDEGIDFRFQLNTFIPAGGFLVVAKDPAALQAKYPGLAALGPFDNKLSHSGERLILRDANDNPADTLHYFDDGRWPEAADAGGASLELRDPRADNSAGEAWAASNETGRTAWRTYSYTGTAAPSAVGPDTQWREFVMGLLDKGEVLLDDISVIETPATTPVELIQNGSFDTETAKWRIIGNHHGTVIDDPDQPGNKVLRLIATGSTEHMSNHGETTFANSRAVINGRPYQISFRARWVSGSRQFNTRLYFNRLARITLLDAPLLHGTPGSVNSVAAANIGPTYFGLRHQPAVPVPFAAVPVTVTAEDPDGVAAMTLWSRVDIVGGAWASGPMTADPSAPNRFSAQLPGKAAGTVVQFYIEGTDGLGVKSTFPAAGANSRALYKVDDGLAKTNGLHNVRLVTLKADADDLHRTINLMSNERILSSLVYDEREIFYNIGLRLKGSEHSRTTTARLGFNVGFNSEQLFRGIHRSVALDRSESTGFGQREMLIHQTLNHAGGLPTKYHDLVQVMAPRPDHTGAAELQLARYTDVFLDDQFENGADGMVFEYELIYQLPPPTDNGTPEGNKVPAPDQVVGTAIRNLGDDKEHYRWTFLIKNNEDRDDYSRLIPWAKWMQTTGASFTGQITTYLDVDQWLRGVAVNVLSGAGDSYGGDGSQHNVQFYVRPTDGRMLYLPHDMDAFFDVNRPTVPNGDVTKIIAVPAYARMYYAHLLDIIATTYNTAYMTRWANHFGQLLPGQPFASHLSFIGQRAAIITSRVNSLVPNVAFAITTNGGNDHEVSNNQLTLGGTAPLAVMTIEVNGVSYPITWTTTTAWSLTVPLMNGANALTLQGIDRHGNLLATALDTITVTNTGPSALLPVVINEFMADNAGPEGFADPADGLFQDWIELFNPNTTAVNLAGYFLTDDLDEPTKWTMPSGVVIAPRGFLLVWADRETHQNVAGADLHADIQLNNDGESLGLFNAAGVAQHTLDFGIQTENVSQGLFPDGDTTTAHFMRQWTPLARNTLAGPLRFSASSITSGMLTLTWDAIPGRTYRVEFKNSFNDPSWTPLGSDVLADSESASTTVTLGATPRRFLRVRRLD
ncbi:MAG: lamin tail domain-containing protein [Verrucomicrobiales bacterium]